MSFFVIIVIVPYLIAVVAFFKPDWLKSLLREWPWEARRREHPGVHQNGIVDPLDQTRPT